MLIRNSVAVNGIETSIYIAGAVLVCMLPVGGDAIWTFPSTLIPGWAFKLLPGLALCVVFAARSKLSERERGGAIAEVSPDAWQRRWFRRTAIFVAAACTLWLLRCTTFYGDGGAIVGFISDGVLFHKREPLSPTLFLLAQQSLGDALGWTPSLTVQIVNTVAGGLGVVALVGIARRIAEPAHVRVAASAVLLSCGAVQLFAGYVENYTLPTVCMLASIACALDALRGRRSVTPAFGLWALSCMFHLAGLVFLPAMAWFVWAGLQESRASVRATALRLLAVSVLPALVLIGLMMHLGFHRADEPGFGGGDGVMFVPLFEQTGMSQYLLFRPRHLLAIANEQLLVAPLGLVMVMTGAIGMAWRGQWRISRDDGGLTINAHVFLLLVAGGFFALTLVWNPDLGPLRDWDLFAPVGFYLNICGVALLAGQLRSCPRRVVALFAFVASVNLSRTLPFMLHNAGL